MTINKKEAAQQEEAFARAMLDAHRAGRLREFLLQQNPACPPATIRKVSAELDRLAATPNAELALDLRLRQAAQLRAAWREGRLREYLSASRPERPISEAEFVEAERLMRALDAEPRKARKSPKERN